MRLARVMANTAAETPGNRATGPVWETHLDFATITVGSFSLRSCKAENQWPAGAASLRNRASFRVSMVMTLPPFSHLCAGKMPFGKQRSKPIDLLDTRYFCDFARDTRTLFFVAAYRRKPGGKPWWSCGTG
jgi:hypothetical protein